MQDFFDFLKVFLALSLLAAAVSLGFAGGGVFGAACGAMLWWLCAAMCDD